MKNGVFILVLCFLGCGTQQNANSDSDLRVEEDADIHEDDASVLEADGASVQPDAPHYECDVGQTGFACCPPERSLSLSEAVAHEVAVGGNFLFHEEFAQMARIPAAGVQPPVNPVGSQMKNPVVAGLVPVYHTDDDMPDILATYMTPSPSLWLIPQTETGWGSPIPIRGNDGKVLSHPCVATLDLVGDAAWDVVCLNPFGFYEGRMTEGGHQRIDLNPESWHAGFSVASGYPVTRDPMGTANLMSQRGNMVRFRDFDLDGVAEGILTTFSEFGEDYLLTRQSNGYYTARAFRTGMTFATCDIDINHDLAPDWLYVFREENGPMVAENVNGMYALPNMERMVAPIWWGTEDRLGWFGMPAVSTQGRTPMGCAYVNWANGYFLSHSPSSSAIFSPNDEGTICDTFEHVNGLRHTDEATFYWGVGFTSWRGRRHEGVVAASATSLGTQTRIPQYVAYDPVQGHVSVYNQEMGGENLTLSGFAEQRGNYYGLLVFGFGRSGRPDALFTLDVREGVVDPLRLFENQLTPDTGEDIICIEVLGIGGESAVVSFEFGDGQIERQLVANGGQIVASPPPVVFQGVSGLARVTIERPGRQPEVFTEVEPGGCYNALPRLGDNVLPPLVRVR